jgi:hypothetical protein
MTSDALIATIERYEAIKIVLDETQLDALAPCRRPSAASTEHITPFLSTVAERRLNVHAAFWWFCGGLPNTVN